MNNYYDVPALSASGINAYYRSPLHYWVESPFNPKKKSRGQTPSMLLGRAIHKIIFEPDTFSSEFAIAPEINRRTNAGKEEYQIFCLQSANKDVLTQEMYNEASVLAQAVMQNEVVCKLLGNGEPEKPLYWEGLIRCKAKLDYYREGLVIDYKSTIGASADEFSKSIVNYGYHRQAAWYMKAVHEVYLEYPKGFVFIVQDKSLPDAIGIYALDGDSIHQGDIENTTAEEQIARRLDTGDWAAFPQMIMTVTLPKWYNKEGY